MTSLAPAVERLVDEQPDRGVIVTAYLLQRDGRSTHDPGTYFRNFARLADTGLPIVAFVEPALADRVIHANVEVRPAGLDSLDLAREIAGLDLRLPGTRNPGKDTADYLTIVNAKLELVRKAADAYPRARRLTWVDFGVAHVLRAPDRTLGGLHDLHRALPGVTLAGIWPTPRKAPLDEISWRFAGGFFTADRDSALRFAFAHRDALRAILPRLTWEVNLWAAMELAGALGAPHGIPMRWYRADHDDSLFDFPRRPSGPAP